MPPSASMNNSGLAIRMLGSRGIGWRGPRAPRQDAIDAFVAAGVSLSGARLMSQLTPNEQRLLRNLCLTDDSYEEIALRLRSNARAVRTAAQRIMTKAEVHSRHGLTLFVWRNRVMQPAQEVSA
jgi:DNA-binding NarL/FixJ family response regulator